MESVNVAARGWSNDGTSSLYEKTRPDYNVESVEFLLEKVGALKPLVATEPFTIVELGAGTGKFTRAALNVLEKHDVQDFKYIATEPLKEMCERFKEMVPTVEILQCPASDLNGMTNNSVDAVLAAMSFQWFYSHQKAIEEIHRVIKPKGMLGLIWYLPDRSVSWIKHIEEMLDQHYEDINQVNTYDKKVFVPLKDHGGFINEGCDLTSYTYSQEFNFSGIMEMYSTKSVIASAERAQKELWLGEIEEEIKTNPETKNKNSLTLKYAMKIHWFQKA